MILISLVLHNSISFNMTMIACTLNKGGPVLLGDILVSGNQKPEDFIIPTLSDDIFKYLPEQEDLFPLCFNQKIYVLSSNTCIGFAGSTYYIKKFLQDIRIFCKAHNTMTPTLMEEFLNGRQDETWDYFECIILIVENDGLGIRLCKALHGKWVRTNSAVFEDVWSTGSGSIDFLVETKEKVEISSQYFPEDPRHAIQTNTVLISILLARERAFLHSVERHWGAGFEMIFYDKEKFTKLDNITYVINQSIIDKGGNIPIPVPSIVLHYKYYGEILIITCIRTIKGRTEETDQKYIIQSNNLVVRPFVVLPLDYFGSEDFSSITKDLSFDNLHNGMGYIFETETGIYLPASVNIGPELKVSFNHIDGLTIVMEKGITDRLISAAESVLMPKRQNES